MMKPQHSTATMTSKASSSHLTMESLALPKELYWDGKSEPVSPPKNELFAIATELIPDIWINDDDFTNEILLLSAENMDHKPNVELLHELIDGDEAVIELCDLKDENWPPQGTGITTQIPYSEHENTISSQPNLLTKFVPTSNDVNFDEYNLGGSTLTTLTPPQSPPRNGAFAAIYEHHDNNPPNPPVQQYTLHYRPAAVPVAVTPIASLAASPANAYLIPDVGITEFQPTPNEHFHNDFNEQSKIVDQIIEECAKDMQDLSDEYESQYTFSPSQMEESTTDEEWTPTNSASSSPARSSSNGSSSSSYCGDERYTAELEKSATAEPVSAKKRRPYGRGIEDRKIRKKEQNKNAATRYRQKKKLEMELVLGEEQVLTQKNVELKAKLDKAASEMKYLKGLIREFYRNQKK